MAVAELNVSRREVLGAACVAPVLSVVEGPLCLACGDGAEWGQLRVTVPGGRDERWGRALARFRAVEAALAAAEGAEDEVFDPLVGRFNRVLTLLLRAPAPDVGALAVKLDLLVTHQAWELDFAETSLAAMRRDAVRLAGGEEVTVT